MKTFDFVVAYEEWRKAIPFTPETRDDYLRIKDALIVSASPEHDFEICVDKAGFTDWVECACGWKSQRFWDGIEFAEQEWRDHVMKDISDER